MSSLGLGLSWCAYPGYANPSTRPDAQLWVESDAGVVHPSGVTTWTDQTANGRNLTASGATEPSYTANDASYNSKPSLGFTAAPATVMTTSAFSVPLPFSILWCGQSSGNGIVADLNGDIGLYSNGGLATWFGGTGGGASSASTASPCVILVVCNGASSGMYVNSSSISVATFSMATAFTLGLTLGNNGVAGPFIGKSVAVGVFSSALSAADRKSVMGYCGSLFGIATS